MHLLFALLNLTQLYVFLICLIIAIVTIAIAITAVISKDSEPDSSEKTENIVLLLGTLTHLVGRMRQSRGDKGS